MTGDVGTLIFVRSGRMTVEVTIGPEATPIDVANAIAVLPDEARLVGADAAGSRSILRFTAPTEKIRSIPPAIGSRK